MTKENFEKGWISLYRSVLNSPLWSRGPLTDFEAWVLILLEVNHKSNKVKIGQKIYNCGRGESVNSILTWSKKFKWSRSKTVRFLKCLENDSMIELKSDTKTTHLKVCNYDSYQGERISNEHQSNINRTSTEHQTSTNNNDNKENKVNKWYESQLSSCKDEDGYKYYKEFIDCLYGNNSTSEPLTNVLKMDQQVSYKQYLKIHNDTIDFGIEYEPILVSMNNWKKLSNNTSVQATLLNWMKREVKA